MTDSSRKRGHPAGADKIDSLSRSISPPTKRSRPSVPQTSPWKLTWIRDLPESDNRDAVTLKDILGDPLISECWEFNYLHDISFLMEAFDPDTRGLVSVNIVHGFWRQDDPNRQAISEEAARFPNVSVHVAPMPEMFGTHHSKMMILFRHDDTAQIVIHTANMIPKDWTNMTNAVWMSPRLPLSKLSEEASRSMGHNMGSGWSFKRDLLAYLRCYNARRQISQSLIDKLKKYDFSAVRGALVASVPGRHPAVKDGNDTTTWGWQALGRCLRNIDCRSGTSDIVVQVSSIATLGATDDWLQNTLFKTLRECKDATNRASHFKVIFPSADEIRQSLDGYRAGASIHTKIQSPQQAKQLRYLLPMLHHWQNNSSRGSAVDDSALMRDGGRGRAAPHIKTYIRYNGEGLIDWGLLTSANLSKQAWGDAPNQKNEMRVASWEIGVLLWPNLYGDKATMLPSFKSDSPQCDIGQDDLATMVGLRVPYSLPLKRYAPDEKPWVATQSYTEVDWMGRSWHS